MPTPDVVLRRICLAYPWSSECLSTGPVAPTEAESRSMWHGEGGYQIASGKNIPTGARCESVQLVPVDHMGKKIGKFTGSATLEDHVRSNGMMGQFPLPRPASMDLTATIHIIAARQRERIHSFI